MPRSRSAFEVNHKFKMFSFSTESGHSFMDVTDNLIECMYALIGTHEFSGKLRCRPTTFTGLHDIHD